MIDGDTFDARTRRPGLAWRQTASCCLLLLMSTWSRAHDGARDKVLMAIFAHPDDEWVVQAPTVRSNDLFDPAAD